MPVADNASVSHAYVRRFQDSLVRSGTEGAGPGRGPCRSVRCTRSGRSGSARQRRVTRPAEPAGAPARLHVSAGARSAPAIRFGGPARTRRGQRGLPVERCLVSGGAARGAVVRRTARGAVSPGVWGAASGDEPHAAGVEPAGQRLGSVGPPDRDGLGPAAPDDGAVRDLWLQSTLLSLERARVLETTLERLPPHFHVAVFPTAYVRHVARLTGRTASAVVAAATGPTRHTVRPGESLWSIASRYDTTPTAIQRSNGLSSSVIHPSQVLEVPVRQ